MKLNCSTFCPWMLDPLHSGSAKIKAQSLEEWRNPLPMDRMLSGTAFQDINLCRGLEKKHFALNGIEEFQ